MVKIGQLERTIKSQEYNVAFYNSTVKNLKWELAKEMAESTRLKYLFDSVHALVVDMRERFSAKDAVVKFVVQDSCAVPGPFLGI